MYIHTDKAPAAVGPYAQAVAVGGMLYTSGQIGLLPATGALIEGGLEAETRQLLANLRAVLEAGGSDLSHVVKTTCFLTDMADFAAFNAIYAEIFGAATPARSCVAVKTLPKNAVAEVEAIAEIIN